ncbi:Malonyl CoA-acyl carrier protein transacylase [Candidatus Westeberhardia cardiocondylae]|uniref:Malonyl CoA-acyl carrier protein transacylase n=1 Tax=Candidatus Westeberhardia cardiocondylae TaxID=1594731 RepID=A0A0H5BWS2_9ENTR|nr:ACP S-malonyltransferase [Candidatus Westeberhardia cardiocondylae]MCR3756438.1 [acyl-carrier-protein] S-malonyltransferase [Candidatus Westeberhardia cardiocondylae]CEN32180.1 Malonyl CoA-acyl carrier protein transacylase [Candidatus Westeberhardia cardiocondylae]
MTILSVVFPGQGSQKIGMLSNLSTIYTEVIDTFNEASTVLGYDLWKLVQNGPEVELNKTWKTQPAILAASVSIWKIWKKIGGKMPELMAGHSQGEYSALVCSESIDFVAAIKLVEFRGKLMQKMSPLGTGSMSVIIGLDINSIRFICNNVKQEQIVEPANFNTPTQIVISGHKSAVKRAEIACLKAGAKNVFTLPISIPSHCLLMKPAAKKLKEKLKTLIISKPNIPVVNNVNVCVENDPIIIKKSLIRQMYNPVHWSNIVQYFFDRGITVSLEMGPGKILTGLVKKNISSLTGISINDYMSLMLAINQQNYWR